MSFYAREVFTGPAALYAFSFPFISEDDVKLYVAGVEDTGRTVQNANPASGGEVVPSVTPGASDEVVVVRETSRDSRLVDYTQPSILTEEDLDADSLQAFYMSQESIDQANVATATANATTSNVESAEAATLAAQAAAEAAQAGAEAAQASVTSSLASAVATATADAEAAQAAAELAQAGAEQAETDAGTYASQAAVSAALAQAAADAVANPIHFAGTFAPSGGAYPTSPVTGAMYRATDSGTVSGVDYNSGDYAAWDGSIWYKFDNTEPARIEYDDLTIEELAEDKEVVLTDYLPEAGSYDLIRARCTSGSFDVALKVGGSAVSGAALTSVGSTYSSTTFGPAAAAEASSVVLSLTNVSAVVGGYIQLRRTV